MGRLERLVWVAKNYFLIIGVAAWFLIPFSVDLLLLLHRYSFLIPFAIWICKKIKEEVTGRNAADVVPDQAAPAPMPSSVANLFDFLFFKPQEEEQWLRGFEVDETSAASQEPAWWLSEPVLAPDVAVGKEAAEEFSWDGVLDTTAWKRDDVAPSAPPISTAYSTSFFPFDDCKAEGGWEHNKSMEETWEAICLMKEEKGRRRRRAKDAGRRRKREVPAAKMDDLFQGMDELMEKQRHRFEFDFRRAESPVQRPGRAAELDRPPPAPFAVTQTRRATELDRPPAAPFSVTQTRRAADLDRRR